MHTVTALAVLKKMEYKQYLDRFEIGRDGSVRKLKTKKLYTICLHNGTAKVNYTVRNEGKRIHKAFSVGQVVYKLFVDENYNGRLFHKDHNPFNNAVENLRPGYGIREEWQIEEFNKYAYPTAKLYLGKWGINESIGHSLSDDFIQDSVMLMWKYLSNFKRGTKFSSFGARYCRIAFLELYKDIKTHKVISLDRRKENERE